MVSARTCTLVLAALCVFCIVLTLGQLLDNVPVLGETQQALNDADKLNILSSLNDNKLPVVDDLKKNLDDTLEKAIEINIPINIKIFISPDLNLPLKLPIFN